MLEFAFRPDPRGRDPVYRQLIGYIVELVEAGRLIPGERLPATRDLAVQLAMSRNTVSRAYRLLVEEDVLSAHVGRGTFVSPRPLRAIEGGRGRGVSADAVRGFAWEGLLAARASRLVLPRGAGAVQQGFTRFDFTGGSVDPELLPVAQLRRAWSRALATSLPVLARPISPLGLPALREEIALSLLARGIACEPDDVLVTNGVHQAFDLVGRALIDPGDTVVIEQPGYFGAALSFRACGSHLVGVGVDEAGLRVDELARVLAARRVKLVVVTPSAQSPTGAVLSERRRAALIELSDRYQIPIFEDDYESELRFESSPLAALKASDPAGRVIYAGTFSKALFPALRVGYVVAARSLLTRLARFRMLADFATDGVSQAAVLELMISGALERHVRRLRRSYAARRLAMLAALERHMPPGVDWTRPSGGHGIWLTLPPEVSGATLQQSAMASGIAYARGDFFGLDGRFENCLALSFVSQPEVKIEAGVAELAAHIAALSSGEGQRNVNGVEHTS